MSSAFKPNSCGGWGHAALGADQLVALYVSRAGWLHIWHCLFSQRATYCWKCSACDPRVYNSKFNLRETVWNDDRSSLASHFVCSMIKNSSIETQHDRISPFIFALSLFLFLIFSIYAHDFCCHVFRNGFLSVFFMDFVVKYAFCVFCFRQTVNSQRRAFKFFGKLLSFLGK